MYYLSWGYNYNYNYRNNLDLNRVTTIILFLLFVPHRIQQNQDVAFSSRHSSVVFFY